MSSHCLDKRHRMIQEERYLHFNSLEIAILFRVLCMLHLHMRLIVIRAERIVLFHIDRSFPLPIQYLILRVGETYWTEYFPILTRPEVKNFFPEDAPLSKNRGWRSQVRLWVLEAIGCRRFEWLKQSICGGYISRLPAGEWEIVLRGFRSSSLLPANRLLLSKDNAKVTSETRDRVCLWVSSSDLQAILGRVLKLELQFFLRILWSHCEK